MTTCPKKLMFIILPVVVASLYSPQETRAAVVTSASQLQSALNAADPGETILVQNNTYSGTFTISRSGTASAPITIRAQNQQQAIFQNSTFNLNGDYIVLKGFIFQNSKVTITGNHNRVARNLFR